eukprot:CAMPEP_0183306816 /NCGR_PEP_ID=MMETSP0160_2-20130417/14611_1 /TAXON_ID=2839 ORGANISM="Odontella Sinensis, Strain Grunow 1884" /NCGR_SAMPLE_ID=MMETSP0160_2 /ASSEMBLY_ACC=CAM_ASM_000250 /LENGTH=169 /DNA_ID=CAMNT_0025470283 /DNA_START=123 /DNA_END=629 /DNA_ORIENTATION=+
MFQRRHRSFHSAALLLLAAQAITIPAIFGFSVPPATVKCRSTHHSRLFESTTSNDVHPAVEGWPDKYGRQLPVTDDDIGPRVIHSDFTVERATEEKLKKFDVKNWPTWTTGDKEKWAVGNQVADKVMPYGELSFMISGELEIIPSNTGKAVVVRPGDFVTFPEGFQASW